MIKTLSKLGIEENFLNLIKYTNKKRTAKIILDEELKVFPLRSGKDDHTKQGCPLSPPLFNIILEV